MVYPSNVFIELAHTLTLSVDSIILITLKFAFYSPGQGDVAQFRENSNLRKCDPEHHHACCR